MPSRSLPTLPTTFLGRETERDQLLQLLTRAAPSTRLVTLTGAGGIGKTRLALEVAAEIERRGSFEDGVWLVELAPLREPERLAQVVAESVGLHEEVGRPIAAVLLDALRTRHMLLVLDNCEHVLAASAELASAVLRGCPRVTILATSREPLGIPGETTRRVPSLDRPDPYVAAPLEQLRQYASVQLFVDRARAASAGFALTAANAQPVATVCAQLDGIPLALELAATRVRALSVSHIARRFEVHFGVLHERARGVAPRHQTLESTIAWSYDLLDAAEQRLFRNLAVFAGTWTLEDAEAISLTDDYDSVLDSLIGLVDKSLVLAEDSPTGEKTYRLLEPIRQFAFERLASAGEDRAARQRHFVWYLGMAEKADQEIRWILDRPWNARVGWMFRLGREFANFRAAYHWALETDQITEGLRLTSALFAYFWTSGHLTEGLEWLARLLAMSAGRPNTPERAWAISIGAKLAAQAGDDVAGRAYALEYLGLPESLHTAPGLGHVHVALSHAALRAGDLAVARQHAAAAVEQATAFGEMARAMYRAYLGNVAAAEGQLDEAQSLFEQAIAEAQSMDFPLGVGLAQQGLAQLAWARGETQRALALSEQAIGFLRESGDIPQVALELLSLGQRTFERGDVESARTHIREALELAIRLGHRLSLIGALTAASLVLNRVSARDRNGLERAEQLMTKVRAFQDDPRSVSIDDLIAEARAALAEPSGAASSREDARDKLTPREQEVTALIARGYSNQQIADTLVIGRRTAEMHVGNILSKLGLDSRAGVAVWAVQHGLTGAEAATSAGAY